MHNSWKWNKKIFMEIIFLSFCFTHLVSTFTENVIKHFYFQIYFKNFFGSWYKDNPLHYWAPKNTSNFFNTFYWTTPDSAKCKVHLFILAPQQCRLLPGHTPTLLSSVHLASFRRVTMVEHSAARSHRVQLEAKMHPSCALNWEIFPGAAVPLQTYC